MATALTPIHTHTHTVWISLLLYVRQGITTVISGVTNASTTHLTRPPPPTHPWQTPPPHFQSILLPRSYLHFSSQHSISLPFGPLFIDLNLVPRLLVLRASLSPSIHRVHGSRHILVSLTFKRERRDEEMLWLWWIYEQIPNSFTAIHKREKTKGCRARRK